MRSERASIIEEEDKVASTMQLSQGAPGTEFVNKPPAVQDEANSSRNPLIEEEKVASEDGSNASHESVVQPAGQQAPQGGGLDKSLLRPDIAGARALADDVGATPGRNWIEAGEILQGQANPARRRGEGRYGAAAVHGLADLAVKAGTGEGGGAAAAALKGVVAPLTTVAPVLKVAKDAAKYTAGGLISSAGQAVQKIGDDKRERLDPKNLLEEQRLTDLANRHEHGIDMTSEEQGLTRREEVAARGVRFEQGDQAKKIWEEPKKRTWGRIAQNVIAAPFRGVAKAVKSLVTSPAEGVKGTVNFFAKYGRKFGNWISNNSWNRKRRAKNALARLRERSAAPVADRHPASPANALTADSPLTGGKKWFLNFRGAEAALRSHTRDVRKAQGFDNILGQKDYEKLSEDDRREYREKENFLLKTSPKYDNAMANVAEDSQLIQGIAQRFDPDPPAGQGQNVQQQAPANAPLANPAVAPDNGEFEMPEKKEAPNLEGTELPEDTHTGMSVAAGIDKGVGVGEKLLETSKKLDMPVGLVTKFLGEQLPDMLQDKAFEDYSPHAEQAKIVGKEFKSFNENVELYRAPLIGEGLHRGFDLYKTAKQHANRDADPNNTALNERRTLEDTREMSNRVRALLQAKKDAGASEESIARTKRLRNKMLMLRLVTANRKLAKAQEMNSVTPLNEYTKKESDFINTGVLANDAEVGAKGISELGKEFGKATLKTLKGAVGYGGTNTSDDTKEKDRLYPPAPADAKANPQPGVGDSDQDVSEEEKPAPKGLDGEGDQQSDSAPNPGQRPRPSQIDFNVDDSSSDRQDSSKGLDGEGDQQSDSAPNRRQGPRPSQIDFNVDDSSSDRQDSSKDAQVPGQAPADLQAPGNPPRQAEAPADVNASLIQQPADRLVQPNAAGPHVEAKPTGQAVAGQVGAPFKPDREGSGAGFGQGSNQSIEEEKVASDAVQIPAGGPPQQQPAPVGETKPSAHEQAGVLPGEEEKGVAPNQVIAASAPKSPAVAGPVMQQLVNGKWLSLAEEEKGDASSAPQSQQASSQQPVSQPSPALGHGQPLPQANANGVGGPAALMGANTGLTGEAGDGSANLPSARKIDDLFRRGRPPAVPYDDATFANRETPVYDVTDDERGKYQADLRAEGFQDVSTRHEGLDLPSAYVHVPDDPDDLPDWVTKFSGPGGQLDLADSQDLDHVQGRDEENHKPFTAQEEQVKRSMRAAQGAAVKDTDFSTKRVVDQAGAMTPDARRQMGPMTVDDREVYPDKPNPSRDANKVFGGWWRHKDTDQRVQAAWLEGDTGADDQFQERRSPAIDKDNVLKVPEPGWDAEPKKPGWRPTKDVKESYEKAMGERSKVVRDAFAAHQRREIEKAPDYLTNSAFAKKEWERLKKEAALAADRQKMSKLGW